MEQRKSDINTGDGNVINVDNNGLNYSFDFSSQVTPAPNQVAQPMGMQQGSQMDGFQPEAQVAPQVISRPEVNMEPMAMPEAMVNGTSPIMGPQVNVVNEATPVASPSVQATPNFDSNVQASNVSVSVVPSDGQVNSQGVQETSINSQVEQGDSMNVQNVQVTPSDVQGEVQNTQQVQGSDEEIIKDKKSTKVFLFTIVAIIVVFIIALPFIRNILG